MIIQIMKIKDVLAQLVNGEIELLGVETDG